MNTSVKYGKFSGKMLLVGCGSIGQGVLRVSMQHVLHRAGIIRVDRYAK